MGKKLFVSTSPHIGSKLNTQKVMLNVVLALLPAVIAGIIVFGLVSLIVTVISVASCVFAEMLYNVLVKKPQTVKDCSAVVTGLILAMNMPPVVPLYIPVISGFFAIIIVKMLFGGLGRNFANPAIAARIFAMLSWTGAMTRFVPPVDYSKGFFKAMTQYLPYMFGVDAVTTATPLAMVKAAAQGAPQGGVSVINMLLGWTGGCIGEISAVAIILGGVYLIVRKIVDWKIPVIYILTTAVFTLIFYKNGYNFILPMILGGGLMFGAFFMATDYSTSPNTALGVIIYAIGLGFITVLIRRFGGYPEGVSFAILLMNLVTPLLDKFINPRSFGEPRKKLFAKREGKNA